MPYNPLHYRKTFSALGSPYDLPATNVSEKQSAVSLLKAIFTATGGPLAQDSVQTHNIADHAVTFQKIQLVDGPCLLGSLQSDGTVEPIQLGAGLTLSGNVLIATGGGGPGGGIISDGQPVSTTMLTGWADASGNIVRGISMPASGLQIVGNQLQLNNDLAALEALNLTDSMFYRSAANTWSPVSFSTAFAFTSGTLALAPGQPLTSLATLPGSADMMPYFTAPSTYSVTTLTPFSRTLFAGGDAASWRATLGVASTALDPDLVSLAGATGTNTIYYRSAPDTWSPVTVGNLLNFAGGTLSITEAELTALAGLASAADRVPYFTGPGAAALATFTSFGRQIVGATDAASGRTVLGINLATLQPLHQNLTGLSGAISAADAVPFFTGATGAMSAFTATSYSRSLLANSDVAAWRSALGVPASAAVQPLDADLTSLAAATGTNTIYYRSAADTWSSVTIGANLTFTGGTLAATAGGGGSVATSGPVTAAMLTGYADATGNLIKGITVGAGLSLASNILTATGGGAGGDVTQAGNNVFTGSNYFTGPKTIFGNNAAVGSNALEVHGLAVAQATVSQFLWAASANGPVLEFNNSRAAAIGTNAILQNGDIVGQIKFRSADGSTFVNSATMTGQVDGSPSAGKVPAKLVFNTMDVAGVTGDRFVIRADGTTESNGSVVFDTSGRARLRSFAKAALGAAPTAGTLAYVSDGDNNRRVAVSDGTVWRYPDGFDVAIGGQFQPLDAELSAIAGVTSAADRLFYYTGSGTGALTTFTSFARQLLDDADAAAMRATLGVDPAGTVPAGVQPLDADLTSLAAAGSTNAIYYRSAANTWSPVTIGSGLSFAGGTLTGSLGTVTTSGAVTATQLAGYADTTGNLIRGVTVGTGLSLSGTTLSAVLGVGGAQPYDGDLASLAAAATTNAIYYRSAADTWAAVTIGTNLTFTGGTLSATGGGGGGTVSTSGAVTSSMLAGFFDSTGNLIKGITVGSGLSLTAGTLTAQGGYTASSTPPATPAPGAFWFDLSTGAFSIYVNDGTSSQWVQIGGGGSIPVVTPSMPQGRLTLQTSTPVMTTTQSAKATVFYSAFVGSLVPIWDGTTFVMTSIGPEISVATTDTAKNPAAIGVNKVNDWFVWLDGATVRLCHGPDWTNDTTRSAGTALVRINGVWVNNVAITNGPAINRGTYVGTTRSNGTSTIDWIVGGANIAGVYGIWNCYNRVDVRNHTFDNTATWSYAATAWRAWRGQNAINRVSAVFGLQEDAVDVTAMIIASLSTGAAYAGVTIDSTTAAPSGSSSRIIGPIDGILTARHVSNQLGWHFWVAMEATDGISATFTGNGAGSNGRCGLFLGARM